VQSGSDRILTAMKRNHTALEYKARIRKLRAVQPDICDQFTDIIVGFPGETEKDFEATMKLIEDIGFDQSFSFIYSRRPARRRPISRTTRDSAQSRKGLKR
jgi:tRNA-2-methylthio-N6-dimethylallyladenosine synthase